MAGADIPGIVNQFIVQATATGGDTWTRIQKSTPLYAHAYAQNLADIAQGVAKGEITPQDAKMYTQNAQLILVQSIANTSHIVLFEVQSFIDGVLGIIKTAINSRLPVPLL